LATLRWGLNVWSAYNLFFLGIGVLLPLAAAGFVLARAYRHTGNGPHLGSLNTEQFAHVASWLSLAFFFITFVTTLDPVLVIGLVGALGLVTTSPLRGLVATLTPSTGGSRRNAPTGGHTGTGYRPHPSTVGPTPAPAPDGSGQDAAYGQAPAYARQDDQQEQDGGRSKPTPMGAMPAYGQAATQDAHEEFRTTPEPAGDEQPQAGSPSGADADEELGMTRLRPRSAEEAAASATAAFGAPGTDAVDAAATEQDTATPAQHTETLDQQATGPSAPRGTEPVEYEAFWFAVGTRRTAVDPEDGSPAFALEPGGWILALEDRGHEFLVQNTDGRTGVLRDLTDIERA
jgi:hypothetical protein